MSDATAADPFPTTELPSKASQETAICDVVVMPMSSVEVAVRSRSIRLALVALALTLLSICLVDCRLGREVLMAICTGMRGSMRVRLVMFEYLVADDIHGGFESIFVKLSGMMMRRCMTTRL